MAAIIVYFSRRGENYVSGALKELSVGNTETAAGMIRELTGAELFQIEPVQPYSRRYNDCIAEAQADQRRNARPELRRYPESLDGYDTIYLGYPNYWGTSPCACLPFWNTSTSPARPSVPSAPTRAAAWAAARRTSNGSARAPR